MILVEPKKGGRSFRDIINATDSPSSAVHDTHMVASAQASSANAWMNTTVVPPTTFKRANDLQQSAQEKQKQLELESIRSRVAAQQAQLDLERKKVEAAMQKKKLEEESLKQQQEQQRLLKEQEEERKRLEIEQIKAEIAKREEEARVRQEQERIKRERERELKQQQLLEILRKDKEAKEAARLERLRREKIEALQDRMHRQRISRAKTLIRRRFTPLIHRVRERIDKRNAKAVERHRMWHFNLCVGIQNPYSSLNLSMMRPLHSTPEGIRERVSKCMLYEKYALEDVKQVSFGGFGTRVQSLILVLL